MKHKAFASLGISLLCLTFMISTISCNQVDTVVPCSISLNKQTIQQLKIQDKEKELSSVKVFTNMNTQAISKIRKALNKATINNIFQYRDVKYLDYCIDNIRYISEIYADGQINKSIQILDDTNHITVYINKNNQSITEITENNCISIDGEQDEPGQNIVIDPITQSNQYISPYTEKETYREKSTVYDGEYMTLHETFDDFNVTESTYIQLESDMNIATLALSLRVSLNAVCKWFESSDMPFDQYNTIPKGTLICIKKIIDFRYGREIYWNSASNTRKRIYGIWSRGTIRYSLKPQGVLYDENNCVEYQTIKMPHAMSLCDEYYRNLGVQLIASESN